jgi:hypothetical protein
MHRITGSREVEERTQVETSREVSANCESNRYGGIGKGLQATDWMMHAHSDVINLW